MQNCGAARRNLAAFPNVELREAPGDHLPLADATLDGVFANMYMHLAPDLLAAIFKMVRALKPEGVLYLADLDTHDHTRQREQMADLWLGFDRSEIREWFTKAGSCGPKSVCNFARSRMDRIDKIYKILFSVISCPSCKSCGCFPPPSSSPIYPW